MAVNTGNGADPWFGLQQIQADELYPTIESGITRLEMAAKMEHPILEVNKGFLN